MDITLENWTIIKWESPIVIIWPNWSWKTTLAAQISRKYNGDFIWATRNLQFQDNIPMSTTLSANNEVNHEKNTQKSEPWRQSNELNNLLAKLKAEESEESTKYTNRARLWDKENVPVTKIHKIINIWKEIFPNREMDFESYKPTITANHQENPTPFSISRMSWWERVWLYLLARIIDANPWIIIIDEPEIHFHSILARKFRDALELARNDCRFVYITHDLPFAKSRCNADYIMVHSNNEVKLIDNENWLPENLIDIILWAATLSVNTKKILFHEGSKKNKRDDEIYSKIFKTNTLSIVPVWSCTNVIDCVKIFNDNSVIKNIEAFGIIDRDYRSETFLETLDKKVSVLKVHELESILCVENVFKIIAWELLSSGTDLWALYNEHIQNIINELKKENNIVKNKTILERIKSKANFIHYQALNKISVDKDIAILKNNYSDIMSENTSIIFIDLFTKEEEAINLILSKNNVEDLIKVFPWKYLLWELLKRCSINNDIYVNMLLKLLSNEDRKELLLNEFKKYIPNYVNILTNN
jgi:hypothetical protein